MFVYNIMYYQFTPGPTTKGGLKQTAFNFSQGGEFFAPWGDCYIS